MAKLSRKLNKKTVYQHTVKIAYKLHCIAIFNTFLYQTSYKIMYKSIQHFCANSRMITVKKPMRRRL